MPWLNCKSFPEIQVPKILCRESFSVRNVGIVHTTTTTLATTTILSNSTNSILNLNNDATDSYDTTIKNLLNQGAFEIPDINLTTIAPVVTNVASKIESNATLLAESINDNITQALSLVSSSISNAAGFFLEKRMNGAAHNRLNTLHEESAISHFMR